MAHASYKIRIYAFLIDYLLIIIYGIFVIGSISFMLRPYVSPLFSGSAITAQLAGFFMITLPVSLYFLLCECSKWQGTFGKRKMGIRVVDDDGRRIGIGRSTFRTAIKLLPWEIAHFGIWHSILPSDLSEVTIFVILYTSNLAMIIYLIIPLTNKKRKNIYDWLAGTKVIY